jgi:acyl-[acyl carrier protein]--UDP-N-acetylglucosamine O-acyltransferase
MIGNENLIMAHAHIGHDAYIGNGCEICTSSVIGGFVTIYDRVKVKLNCTIRNRLIIGMDSIIGMGSVVTKDVPAFTTVYGNPAREKEKTINEQVEELKSQLAKQKINDETANAMFVSHVVGGFVFPERTKAILFWGAICVGIGMLTTYLFMV